MIGINGGIFIGYAHKPPKYFINKKGYAQAYLTLQQPNPKPQSQLKSTRYSIYATFVCFGDMAKKVRDLVFENDFVVVNYTIRNYKRGRSGFGHSLQLVNVFPWRPNRRAERQEGGEWSWGEIIDGALSERMPNYPGEGDDREWSFGGG